MMSSFTNLYTKIEENNKKYLVQQEKERLALENRLAKEERERIEKEKKEHEEKLRQAILQETKDEYFSVVQRDRYEKFVTHILGYIINYIIEKNEEVCINTDVKLSDIIVSLKAISSFDETMLFLYEPDHVENFINSNNLGKFINEGYKRFKIEWNKGTTVKNLIDAYMMELQEIYYYEKSNSELKNDLEEFKAKYNEEYLNAVTYETKKFLASINHAEFDYLINDNVKSKKKISPITLYYIQRLLPMYQEFDFDLKGLLSENLIFALFLTIKSDFGKETILNITNVLEEQLNTIVDFYNNHYIEDKGMERSLEKK